ncbi:hypothetical protein [Streptomyces capitiformicae]|nr:hypothetical protein [Streptomyces capitiformicae]
MRASKTWGPKTMVNGWRGEGRADAAFELALDGVPAHARRGPEAYAQV